MKISSTLHFAVLLSWSLVQPLSAQSPPTNDPYEKTNNSAASSAKREVMAQVSILEETFSLPLESAQTVLHTAGTDEKRYAAVRELQVAGQAQLERLLMLRTKSGHRAVEGESKMRTGNS